MTTKRPRKTRHDWGPYDTYLPLAHARVRRGDFPPPEVMAELIENNRNTVLPAWLIDMVCAQLRGELKRKRGVKPRTEWRQVMVDIADLDYRQHLAWLQRRSDKR